MTRHVLRAACALLLALASCTMVSDRTTIDIDGGWQFRRAGTAVWRRATVPGCVHTDLLALGLIEDPFVGANEKDLQWIEREDWEYRTAFQAAKALVARGNAELEFEGLDTYADVYLNDSLLLRADNMFRLWRVPCAGLLREGRNELRVYFHSPVSAVEAQWKALPCALPGGPRVLTRKAAYQYGWDWSPRFVTSGIWRPVRLVTWDAARITAMAVAQDAVTERSAELTVRVAVESAAPRPATLSIALDRGIFVSVPVDLAPGQNEIPVHVSIPDPELWWTNGLGKQRRYRLLAELREGGTLLDWRARRIGIRTIELVRGRDAEGTGFTFRLNGIPVFMKGANFVPRDSFLPRADRDRCEYLVASAAAAGMNMLRVWGGGVYEDDAFYDLCDEYGILVWQDFCFACAMYPGDSAFVENVRREAIDNVERLRDHPCLALWCGNNEIDEAWHNWGWQREYGYSPADSARIWGDYVRLFHEVLPAVVDSLDGERPYWPSSPSRGRADPRSLTEGDSHYWGVWHDGEPFEAFRTHVPRFMSEFGFQSYPSIGSLARFSLPPDPALASETMLAHQKAPRGNEIIEGYLRRSYREPRDFASFVYVTQLLQAEGVREGIEAQRRAKPFCMGSLFWQLDDCWPAASWSAIDYDGDLKALWYAARDAFSEVLVSPVVENDTARVFVVSDRLEPVDGPVVLRLLDFYGRVIWETSRRVRIRANSSRPVFEDGVSHLLAGENPAEVVLSAEIFEGGKSLSRNLLYFVPPKDLVLLRPEFARIDVTPAGRADVAGSTVILRTDVLAKNVYLFVPGHTGYFDENFFDMLPGSRVEVHFVTNERIRSFDAAVRVVSLADTY
jgi:beta-mannosidase